MMTSDTMKPALQDIQRDSKGRYVPGQSGNPTGNPVGAVVSLVVLLRKRLSEHPEDADAVVNALVKLGMNSDLAAIKEMTDRIDGKVTDKLQVDGIFLIATPDQLAEASDRLLLGIEEQKKLLELEESK